MVTPQKPQHGGGVSLAGSLDHIYDIGKPQNLVWGSRISLYNIDHLEMPTFDYSQTDIQTGPAYYGKEYRFKLPVGYVDRRFAHTGLSDSWYLDPEVSKKISEAINLKLSYRFESESFDKSTNQDSKTNTITLEPSYMLQGKEKDALHVFSLQAGVSDKNAEVGQYSYTDLDIAPSWFYRTGSQIETYLQVKYQNRDYQGNTLVAGLGVPSTRRDDRFSATSMLRKTFNKKYFVSGTLSLTHNDSNDDRYSYDKVVVGVNTGVKLDF